MAKVLTAKQIGANVWKVGGAVIVRERDAKLRYAVSGRLDGQIARFHNFDVATRCARYFDAECKAAGSR